MLPSLDKLPQFLSLCALSTLLPRCGSQFFLGECIRASHASVRFAVPKEITRPSPRKYWTRRGIVEWLVGRLSEETLTYRTRGPSLRCPEPSSR